MRTTKLFKVIEGGKEIYCGSAVEICKYLNLAGKDIVYAYARSGYELYGRFTFIPSGIRKTEGNKKTLAKQEKAKPKPTKHEQKLNYLAWHLQHYGNTTLKGHPSKYKEELKQMGIEFTYRKYDKKDYILECY